MLLPTNLGCIDLDGRISLKIFLSQKWADSKYSFINIIVSIYKIDS
jgi:hypothetical protein